MSPRGDSLGSLAKPPSPSPLAAVSLYTQTRYRHLGSATHKEVGLMASSATSVGGSGYTSSQAAQAALYAEMFTLKCETGYIAFGLQHGEAVSTPIRIVCTLITVSVASAWFSRRKSIKTLLLFFSHWLSGLLHQVFLMFEAAMILVCWTGDNLSTLIKTVKFIELASSNMLAITNLAICVNLSLVITSHRTLSRVKSVSSPRLIFLFLAISIGAAAASAIFWKTPIIGGTGFWFANDDERAQDWVTSSIFCIEFVVGACMLLIVVWLLAFRMKEVKECWKLHVRIRYYFGLTLIGTAVNLALGICGTVFVLTGSKETYLLLLTWAFRYVHIALDTIVLYGMLGSRNVNERAGSLPDDGGSGTTDSAGFHASRKRRLINARASNGSSNRSSNNHRISSSRNAGRKAKIPSEDLSVAELPLQWDR